MVASGNKLDGLWFETWSRLSIQGIVNYCSSVVWQVGSSGGLVESLDHSSMLCGRLSTLWLDFHWLVMVSCNGYSSGALAPTIVCIIG
jgi:hypothetical protein